MTLIALDFEASCLPRHGRSYPIEIGIADEHGLIRSWLIRPPDAWAGWGWTQEAERLHGISKEQLARDGLPLYAQHVDPIDTGTLVDIFRDDPRASLLGTDALRDGVDVPGHSLRLVVMEGVPWSKPTVLHAARRLAGGGSAYDDRLIRARLAQAFGRLIRRAEDKGSFVILSAAMPSRLLSAFPPGTPIRRLTLDEAIIAVSAKMQARDMQDAGLGDRTTLGHQGSEPGMR